MRMYELGECIKIIEEISHGKLDIQVYMKMIWVYRKTTLVAFIRQIPDGRYRISLPSSDNSYTLNSHDFDTFDELCNFLRNKFLDVVVVKWV